MSRRGFTILELAVVLSIISVLLPLVYALARDVDRSQQAALWQMQDAQAARTVTQELQRDLFTLTEIATARESDVLLLSGPCGEVRYQALDGVLVRGAEAACGGTRALARNVRSFKGDETFWRMSFQHLPATGAPVSNEFLLRERGWQP